MEKETCIHCGDKFPKSPRHKNQDCCPKKKCRRAKKADWQKQKLKCDPEYKRNQKFNNRKWQTSKPGYWKEYREKNPEKVERNRLLQKNRNKKNKASCFSGQEKIAKLDEPKISEVPKIDITGQYLLIPLIAKMAPFKVKLVVIPDVMNDCKDGRVNML